MALMASCWRSRTESIGGCTSCSCSSSRKEDAMTLVATQRATPTLRLEWRSDGSLWAVRGGEERAVAVRRCFPWSEPARYLSLRDSEEEEFAVVRDPADLDGRSRAALEMALAVAGFVFELTRLLEIHEGGEIRHSCVQTLQGPRTCPIRLAHCARTVSHCRLF